MLDTATIEALRFRPVQLPAWPSNTVQWHTLQN
jgi:hypothetical protein